MTALELGAFPHERAGELLTLQRAAYVTEAQVYDDPRLPALVQTLPELLAELADSSCLAVWSDQRLAGAVRARDVQGVLHVGRLVVAPDLQGRGIGSRLLAGVEASAVCRVATLFTGHRSTANLRLYARHGYTENHRERLADRVELVHLAKELAG